MGLYPVQWWSLCSTSKTINASHSLVIKILQFRGKPMALPKPVRWNKVSHGILGKPITSLITGFETKCMDFRVDAAYQVATRAESVRNTRSWWQFEPLYQAGIKSALSCMFLVIKANGFTFCLSQFEISWHLS